MPPYCFIVLFLIITFGDSGAAVCVPGMWGAACDQTCHCASELSCDQMTAACASNSCDAGYVYVPICQTPCVTGFFWYGCTKICHCMPGDTCSNVNGQCSTGCDPNYTGAGCQNRRTQLGSAPRVMDVTCDSLRVTWSRWNNVSTSGDIGDLLPIRGYQLQSNINNTVWNDEGAFQDEIPGNTTYQRIITNINRYNTYMYRVRADGTQYNKTVLGSPSTPSDPISCSAPTPPPTQSTSVPGPVNNPIVTALTSTSIRVTWRPPNTGGDTDGYTITYLKKGIGIGGSCVLLNSTQPTVIVVDKFTLSRDIDNLDQWSNYDTILFASNAAGNGQTTTININTLDAEPTGRVTGLVADSVTSSSFTLRWAALPCDQRRGDIITYEVQLQTPAGVSILKSTTTSLVVNNLDTATQYTLAVRFVNQRGATVFSDPIVVTTGIAVPSVPLSLSVVPRPTSAYVTWLPPNPTNGQILEYQVSYRQVSIPNSGSGNISAGTNLGTNITGLTTGSTYAFMVRARNALNWGPFTAEQPVVLPDVSTLPGRPSVPTMVSTTSTSATINWAPPTLTNGNIIKYRVVYIRTNTSSTLPTNPSGELLVDPPPQTAVFVTNMINNLDPASTYTVSVSASNSQGYGEPSSPVEIMTYPGVPPEPNPPTVISGSITSTTATVRVYTVTSSLGAVSSTNVYVRYVTSSRRRKKRATADCSAGARMQITLLPNQFSNLFVDVVLGDGSSHNGVNNAALDPARQYEICVQVVASYRSLSAFSYTKSANPFTTASAANYNYDWIWILFIVIVSILIVVFLVVIIVILNRRRIRKENAENLNKTWLNYYKNNYDRFDDSLPKVQPYGRWSDITDYSQPRHVEHMREAMDPVSPEVITTEEEYHHLPQGQQHTCTQSLRPEYDVKNRFEQFLPYDHSRVVNRRLDGLDLYVNANYIDGYQKPKAYIAAQSPFNSETVCDFWEMVYQENSAQIITLCHTVEDGIMKCEQFWPDEGTRTFRHLAVTLRTTETFAHYVVRQFDVTPQNYMSKSKVVTQFQYQSWPAHGIPSDPIPYLEFVFKVRCRSGPGAGPAVVHCGTGISRTAVHIAVDALIKQGFKEGEVSVFDFCSSMRRNRVAMVRTPSQYSFIYETLFEALMTSDYILDLDMRTTYKRLLHKNKRTGKTELLEQFKILRYYTAGQNEELCKAALRSENRDKNRYLNILPPDEFRATIKTPGGVKRNDYINAIFLDGHTSRNAFLVTQTPLTSTCIDFWKLCYDHKVSIIVHLHDKSYKDETLSEYWPKTDSMKRYDPFFVTLKSSVKEKDFVVKRYLSLSNSQHKHDKSRDIKQYQLFSGWHMYDKVPDRDALLQLVDSVYDEQRRQLTEHGTIGPVLVHCADGATRSGLFCTLMILIEKMRVDRYVDIFHTVKSLKRRRPQFIDDFEQYKMCFKALWEHVNTRFKSTYSLSRISKDSHENLDTIDSTRDSMLDPIPEQ